MQRLFSSAIVFAFLATAGGAASAKACRDAKGKFVKCSAMTSSMKAKPMHCRDAKGKFMKCKS